MWRVVVAFADADVDVYAYRSQDAAWKAFRGVVAAMHDDPAGFEGVELVNPLGEVALAEGPHRLAPLSGGVLVGALRGAWGPR